MVDYVGMRTEGHKARTDTGGFWAGFRMDVNIIPAWEGRGERRKDGPTDTIDEAVVLAAIDGVGPALDYMSSQGVPRATAIRVLTGPRYHRRPRTQAVSNALRLIASKINRKR